MLFVFFRRGLLILGSKGQQHRIR